MRRFFVVGPVTGFTSYPTVLKGILRGFAEVGLEPVVADTSHMGGEHANGELDDVDGISWLDSHQTAELSGGAIPEGVSGVEPWVFALNPTVHMAKGLRAGEKGALGHLVGLHVGDVDRMPAVWVEVMERESLVVVPSSWLGRVVRAGLEDREIGTEVMVAHHGVGPAFEQVVGAEPEGNGELVRLLHTCSSMYFPERKGTPQALGAFQKLVSEGRPLRLSLVVPQLTKPLKRILKALDDEARGRIDVVQHPDGMPSEVIADLYRRHNALLAPSRAEGFGMQPLECRACGRPTIQTLATGMEDHLRRAGAGIDQGVVQVPHGELIDAWGDFGRAPEVTADVVYNSLCFFLANRAGLEEAARESASEVAHAWSWESVTRQLADWLGAV